MNQQMRDHNEGERAGAEAGLLDRLVAHLNPFLSEHYLQGFRNGVRQRQSGVVTKLLAEPSQAPEREQSDQSSSGGAISGGEMPLVLKLVFGGMLLGLILPAIVIRWAFGSLARLLVACLPCLFFALSAATGPANGRLSEVAAQWAFALMSAALGFAIGETRKRPWSGFLLGMFLCFVGWIVAALLPVRDTGRRQASRTPVATMLDSISGMSPKALTIGVLAFAPLAMWFGSFIGMKIFLAVPQNERLEFLAPLLIRGLVGSIALALIGIVVFIWDAGHNPNVDDCDRGLWIALLFFFEPFVAPLYFWRFIR